MPCSNQVRFNAAAGHKQVLADIAVKSTKAGEVKSCIGKLKLSPSQLSKLESGTIGLTLCLVLLSSLIPLPLTLPPSTHLPKTGLFWAVYLLLASWTSHDKKRPHAILGTYDRVHGFNWCVIGSPILQSAIRNKTSRISNGLTHTYLWFALSRYGHAASKNIQTID